MSQTHVDGQVLTHCPDCSHSIRLRPNHSSPSRIASLVCGSCGNEFDADRENGEVVVA